MRRPFSKFPSRRARGFTLIELIVAITIVAVMGAVVVPAVMNHVSEARRTAARSDVNTLMQSLKLYKMDNGRYPSGEQGLAALDTAPSNEAQWDGPYLKKAVPPDPWGKPYIYRQPGEHNEFDLFSYGKDGQAGGTGDAADVTNW